MLVSRTDDVLVVVFSDRGDLAWRFAVSSGSQGGVRRDGKKVGKMIEMKNKEESLN